MVYRAKVNIKYIHWDEVALEFFFFPNNSQETSSNALSDYTSYIMGRNHLVLQESDSVGEAPG